MYLLWDLSMDPSVGKERTRVKIRIGKRHKIQFTDKKHPLIGIFSMIIAIVSLLVMIILFICSGMEKGNGSILYGYLGILNLILSITGFVFALRCFKREDIYMTTPTVGSVLNGIIIILYLILYFLGTL